MPFSPVVSQATAYDTAVRVLAPSNVSGIERRAAKRHPFRFVQRIAAYERGEPIGRLRFFPVQCHDISRRGIAFLLPDRLDFSTIVIELGSDDKRMYFQAEIVTCRPLDPSTGGMSSTFGRGVGTGDPSRTFLIGCRFKRKIELPSA